MGSMCGRYLLRSKGEDIGRAFGARIDLDLVPRYNVAPSLMLPVVRADEEGARRADLLRWGLVPGWAKDLSIGNKLVNARSETVAEKPSFRRAFKKRRCVVPMDGFYEWKATPTGKQPYLATMKDGSLLGVAGLWERWEPKDGEPVESFTLLTTEANDLLAEVHHRMPVLLGTGELPVWLDPGVSDRDALEAMFRPYPSELMEIRPVSRRLNSVKNDDPSVLEADPE